MTAAHPPSVAPVSLRPGAVLLIDGCASVQFGGDRALRLRLVSVDDKPTYDGWVWLTGYVLGPRGEAVARRELYVQRAGLHAIAPAPVVGVQQRRPVAMGRVRG
ncbi:hypothetical protein C5N14_13520 [Micromonospora sp. MW-13]|uniref:hypothetical protein n=1 Tax=Micromonospora sp. MW-13 TaxID=2094022 RepID=UPI000EDA5D06|nr:hypothetical protein [Micromonospora sp. MW-13]RGC68400.1 hypothetical protein C5N14_13520 [Micromonospora sp. MW-13]